MDGPAPRAVGAPPTDCHVSTPEVVIRPTRPGELPSTNHSAPSAPVVIERGFVVELRPAVKLSAVFVARS